MKYDATAKKVSFDVIIPKFDLTTKVHIDGDRSITATVIGFLVRASQIQFEVAWFSNGSQQTAWIDDFRLSQAEA